MKPKNIVVTGGGTREYIDDVRVLTNISTGKLSAAICDHFGLYGHQVTYVHAKGSALPSNPNINKVEVGSVVNLMDAMTSIAPNADAIIHAMAVSDFTFDRSEKIKLKSNSPDDFIEFMRRSIRMNPKVIASFREWNPTAYLVGFKFEVGLSTEDLIDVAFNLLTKNKLDLVVANDKTEMEKLKIHRAYFLKPDKSFISVDTKLGIARTIYEAFYKNEIAKETEAV